VLWEAVASRDFEKEGKENQVKEKEENVVHYIHATIVVKFLDLPHYMKMMYNILGKTKDRKRERGWGFVPDLFLCIL